MLYDFLLFHIEPYLDTTVTSAKCHHLQQETWEEGCMNCLYIRVVVYFKSLEDVEPYINNAIEYHKENLLVTEPIIRLCIGAV